MESKTYENGDVYVGDLVNDKPHGKGVLTQPSGHKLDGDWIDGEFTGRGSYKYPKGSVYGGDLVNGKRHGKGVYVKKRNGKYTIEDGYWFDDDYVGKDESVFQLLQGNFTKN